MVEQRREGVNIKGKKMHTRREQDVGSGKFR